MNSSLVESVMLNTIHEARKLTTRQNPGTNNKTNTLRVMTSHQHWRKHEVLNLEVIKGLHKTEFVTRSYDISCDHSPIMIYYLHKPVLNKKIHS